ncbi:MAG TPA: XdhC family protein [Longimicrobiales bacterium]|nr:XdhC family protein [Longimicrobiales bacterium]
MEPNEELLRAVIRVETERAPSALATVVRVRGSTPRSAGASMLIEASGATVGTIGGGCGEADVLSAARAVIASGRPRVVRVDLTDDVTSLSPAVCGGVMDVLVEPVVRGGSGHDAGEGA